MNLEEEKWKEILSLYETRIHKLETMIQEKDTMIQSLQFQLETMRTISPIPVTNTTMTTNHPSKVNYSLGNIIIEQQQQTTTTGTVADTETAAADTAILTAMTRNPHDDDDDDDVPQTFPSKNDKLIDMILGDNNYDDNQTTATSCHNNNQYSLLSSSDIERYSRQLIIPYGFGIQGQIQLQSSTLLVIGAGGIGSTVLLYLAACGIKHITIVDSDIVEISNLHRQIIHSHNTLGMNKALSAQYTLHKLNSTLSIKAITQRFTRYNAWDIIQEYTYTLVIDASDNAETRYCVNDICVLAGNIPLVSGSAMGLEGQVSIHVNRSCIRNNKNNKGESTPYNSLVHQQQQQQTSHGIITVDTDDNKRIIDNIKNQGQQQVSTTHHYCNDNLIPCYRCMYPTMPQSEGCKSCNDYGVLGPIPGLIGILVSIEAIKLITGIGKPLIDKLLMYDSMQQPSFYTFKKPSLQRRTDCIVCYPLPTRRMDSTYNTTNASSSSSSTTTTTLELDYRKYMQSTILVQASTTSPFSPTCLTLSTQDSLYSSYPIEITWKDYIQSIQKQQIPHILLDVRVRKQYEMCSLPGSINIPLHELKSNILQLQHELKDGQEPIYCICRRGIASLAATEFLSTYHRHEQQPPPHHDVSQESKKNSKNTIKTTFQTTRIMGVLFGGGERMIE